MALFKLSPGARLLLTLFTSAVDCHESDDVREILMPTESPQTLDPAACSTHDVSRYLQPPEPTPLLQFELLG